ncbi:SpaA isopeptide-forming pilin-related protein [Ruminococcus bromii]|uniref:SpaA isopeptide-forming pilin-related protein n=1 Tax=Ruminococcus bromii TaxID=40518 RepID=UPI003AB2C005
MKMQKAKRFLSLFLAALMCVTTLVGFGTTAYAAEETDEVYLVSFPRDGDENYGAEWGHGSHTFMNGWSSGSSRFTTVRAMGSYNGNICYCIEVGVPQETGDSYTQKGEDFWDNYPSSYNSTISPDDIKLYIGRIFQYGYTGTISTSWRSQNEGGDKLAHAVATQLLIWETVVGERDEDFNKVSTGGKDAILDQISPEHPLYDKIMRYYDSMAASVQNHSKLPSFFAKSTGKAQNIELEWDGEKYTATLTDQNNVLSDYSFSASDSGIRFSVNGNKLTITAEKAPSDTVTITAEKTVQRRGIITWTDGVYGPDGGVQDTVTYAQTVNDPIKGYLNIKVSYGSAKIVKTSEDGKVEGITFTVTGNGVNQTVQTSPNGEIQIDNLTPGVYTVTEQSYDKYEPQEVRRVTVVSGQVATVNFNNVLKRGDLTVTKTSEDGLNEGVTFRLSGTSLSGLAVDEYAVTDSSGVARFDDVLIGTGYVLEEVDTAIRYVVPENQTAAVEWNTVTNKSFHNVLKKWNLTVTKSDNETGTPQGDASLAGAVYGIYKGEQLIDTYTTDENGQFVTKYYICGDDWSLREIEPSEGYLLDESVHHIGAEAKNYTVEYNAVASDVGEQIIKGRIALIKHTDDGGTGLETPEAGAEFEVFLKSAGSYEAAKETERDYLICDENGYCQSADLVYGTYTVHQVKGWDGRELLPDFDVYVSQNGEVYRYLANNANFESYIKIVKVDAETGKTIPYAGAGFQLYRPDGTLITQSFTYPEPVTIDTFYTNDEGWLITPEKLEYGTGYSLVEVSAPYGYVLNSEPVYFDVVQDASADEGGIAVIEVIKENAAQKGIIKISKTGEVFSSVTESEGVYQPVYSVQGLAGAVYEITAAEDIVTPDGTLRYTACEVVDTVTTDDTGLAESEPLYLGKYEIREITAPYGMVLNGEVHTAELTYAGQEIEITETAASFYNERQKATVTLDKILEQNEQFGIGANGEITTVTFGLFAAEDVTATDGSVIPADGLLEILSVDEGGHAVCKTDLPFGSFYFKELSTDEHYILSDKKYPFEFSYMGQDTALVEIKANDGEAIGNNLIYGEIHGLKKDENGNALGGAVIGLFKPDCTEFITENAIMSAISAEDGSFSFANVPFGNWVVHEIEAPAGFVLSEKSFVVTIDKDGAIIEVEIENTLIRGNVQLTKTDRDYPDNKLTGAKFTVYRDSNGDKAFDENDEKIGELSEVSTGVYEMHDLTYGGYFVKEQQAPEGFCLDENAYYFEITEHGKTVTVENETGKGFVNTPQVGSLKIVKTSSDGKVEGFSFRVTGSNGYSEVFVTDENGEIFIENLRIGDYTVSEVSDGASAAYVLPADKTASVFESAVTTVEMHNELRDIPKTGDDRNPALWLSLLGVSAAGAAVLGVIGLKKKSKKEDAE